MFPETKDDYDLISITIRIRFDLGLIPQRSSQKPFLAVIFPFSKSERGGKRGSTTPDDCWLLGINPRFHVLFQRCRQGQNDTNEAAKMSTIGMFLPTFSLLECEGSHGSHLTVRPFMKPRRPTGQGRHAHTISPHLAIPKSVLPAPMVTRSCLSVT